MKKLIIVSHPHINTSVVNKRWVEELEKHPDHFTIHNIYESYPDGKIDVEKEQQLVEAHDAVVFQFPFYWFSSPPLLKQWMDDVLTYGWAYGSTGKKLNDKKIALAISVGVYEEDYRADGKNEVTFERLLLPFRTMALYVNANYKGHFAFYGAEHDPSIEDIDKSAREYASFVMDL